MQQLIRNIEVNALNPQIDILELYIDTEIDAKKRKAARKLLEDTKAYSSLIMSTLQGITEKYKFDDNTEQIKQIMTKLEKDFHRQMEINNELN